MDTKKMINAIPLFEGLSDAQQKSITNITSVKSYNRGDMVFFEGDEAHGFYIIISGSIKIYKLSNDGKEQILHIWGAGEPFGEVPVFEGKSFPANAEAIKESRVLFISRSAFIDLINEDPSISLKMLAVLSKRLRKFTKLVEDLTLKEVPERLANYFLYLNDNQDNQKPDTLYLDVAKNQLASLLGTIPETLSRILTKMKDNGLIRLDGRKVKILDRKELEAIAKGKKIGK